MVAPKSCRGCVLLVAAWLQLVSGGVFQPRHWLSSTLHADQSTMAPPTCAQTTEIKSGQFLFGGAEYSKAMFIYDVSTNLTSPIEDFPVDILFAEGMVFKCKPTVCGGLTTNQCFDYDPTNSHWNVIPGMFTASSRAYMRMVSFGADKVALMGGSSGINEVISLNSTFDYTTEASLPDPLTSMCALSLNDSHIFVAGGYGSGSRSEAYLYDVTNGNIENLANMGEARYGIRCQSRAKLGGGQEIVVVGGIGTTGALSTTEIYDLASNTWNSGTPFPSPVQFYAGLLNFENDLYLLGGYNDDGNIAAIWKLGSAENTWTKVTDLTEEKGGIGGVAMSIPG